MPLFFFSGPSRLGRPILRRTPEPHWWRQTQNAMVPFFSFFFFISLSFHCFFTHYTVLGILRYFKEHGWPSSTLFETPPTNDEDRAKLIDTLQVFLSYLFYLSISCFTLLHHMVVTVQMNWVTKFLILHELGCLLAGYYIELIRML